MVLSEAMLGFIAAVLSAFLASISIAFDYRDQAGRLNVWGRAALLGAVVSALVAFLAQVSDSRQAARRQRELLTSISRSFYRLGPQDFAVSIVVSLPLNIPELQPYATRLKEAANAAIKRGPHGQAGDCERVSGTESVDFLACSPAFPNPPETDRVASALLGQLGIGMSFLPKNIQGPVQEMPVNPPPLRLILVEGTRPQTFYFWARGRPSYIEYSDSSEDLVVHVDGMQPIPNLGSFVQRLWALPDLTGSKMTVSLEDLDFPTQQEQDDYDRAAEASTISFVDLKVGPMSLDFSPLTRVRQGSSVDFTCQLPDRDILFLYGDIVCGARYREDEPNLWSRMVGAF
jgi:hypothetical protein